MKGGENELLGCILLYVGMVLMSNGFYAVEDIKDKSIVVMNFFTGGLSLTLNIVALSWGTMPVPPGCYSHLLIFM